MDNLEKIILVASGDDVEIKKLSDNKKDNTALLNEICDRMHEGSMAAFGLKKYAACFLFHLVRDVYDKFPDLIDLEAVYDHIQPYGAWAIEESKRDVERFIKNRWGKK